jgi:hypothetical protein
MSLDSVSLPAFTPRFINCLSYRLRMSGVHTKPSPTKVIKLKSFRNRTIFQHPRNTVNSLGIYFLTPAILRTTES